MSGKGYIVDPALLDTSQVIADIDAIRRCNPQRHEMEQVTALIYEDLTRNIYAGYKDITADEFWVRGHMPGMPLMPGVIMLEAVAQMSSYFVQKHDFLQTELVGLGGFEDVRFRGTVVPGDRLVIVGQMTKCRPKRMVMSRFQGLVGDSIVVEGILKGIALPVDMLKQQTGTS